MQKKTFDATNKSLRDAVRVQRKNQTSVNGGEQRERKRNKELGAGEETSSSVSLFIGGHRSKGKRLANKGGTAARGLSIYPRGKRVDYLRILYFRNNHLSKTNLEER